jgi:hypothetical protein
MQTLNSSISSSNSSNLMNSPKRRLKCESAKENLPPSANQNAARYIAAESSIHPMSPSVVKSEKQPVLHTHLGEKMLSSAQLSDATATTSAAHMAAKVANSLNNHSLPQFPLISCENRLSGPPPPPMRRQERQEMAATQESRSSTCLEASTIANNSINLLHFMIFFFFNNNLKFNTKINKEAAADMVKKKSSSEKSNRICCSSSSSGGEFRLNPFLMNGMDTFGRFMRYSLNLNIDTVIEMITNPRIQYWIDRAKSHGFVYQTNSKSKNNKNNNNNCCLILMLYMSYCLFYGSCFGLKLN